MKIEAIQRVSQVQEATQQAAPSNKSFEQIQQKIGARSDYHQELVKLEQAIIDGKELKPRELLFHQIQAQQFHLQVELVSKAAESLMATARKLQSSQ